MKKRFCDLVETARITLGKFGSPHCAPFGMFLFEGLPSCAVLQVIASDGYGWDHVSVSVPGEERCPTWEEMDWVKRKFWDDAEIVLQFHIHGEAKVNAHPYCLHLWKSHTARIHTPPSWMVGPPSQPALKSTKESPHGE